MFDCIIVAISRSIEIVVVPLYESAWLGNEVGCSWAVGFVWSWFVLFVSDCDLGTHLFDTCFVVKRVL